ncbi:hypothetical protein MNBD_ALPHA02-619 [hydrothermal vent metagenome]|uniref:TrfB transcriptional repressor protein domain-containing protein n=1 Tax=hydrothermal vent metagenome TaxID=652676 RepID=A0A3B0RMD9_9ZZZZ
MARLTESDAEIIKGMLFRGDKQSDIAAYFGVNIGRISEINNRYKFAHVKKNHPDTLPPLYAYSPKDIYTTIMELHKKHQTEFEQVLTIINPDAYKKTKVQKNNPKKIFIKLPIKLKLNQKNNFKASCPCPSGYEEHV